MRKADTPLKLRLALLATPVAMAAISSAQAGLTDVALQANGGTAYAESVGTYLGDVQAPWKATDGNPATGWSSNGTCPSWLAVQFEDSFEIHAIGIHWSSHVHTYTVSLSPDGAGWTQVLGPSISPNVEGGPDVYEYLPIPPQPAQFVRIDLLTTSAPASHIFQSSVHDLEAYTCEPVPQLSEDFSSGIIDPSTWGVILPFSDSSVAVVNGACELKNRGILHTLAGFDPASDGAVKVEFEWQDAMGCSSCGTDAFYMCTRTDLAQTGCCGQPTTGVFFQFSPANPVEGPTANLWVQVGDKVEPSAKEVFSVPVGADVRVELVDSGTHVVGRFWEVGNPGNKVKLSLKVPAETQGLLGEHVAIYNREHVSGDYVVYVEDVTISTGGIGAAEFTRVGTPPNSDVLLPGVTSGPVLGGTWDPVIDHATFLPGAVLDGLAVGSLPANQPSVFGTLLVSPLGPVLLANASAPGQAFQLPIPSECSLVGASLSAQGYSFDALGLQLTNALDITIGSI